MKLVEGAIRLPKKVLIEVPSKDGVGIVYKAEEKNGRLVVIYDKFIPSDGKSLSAVGLLDTFSSSCVLYLGGSVQLKDAGGLPIGIEIEYEDDSASVRPSIPRVSRDSL